MDGLNPTAQEGTKPQWFVMRDLKRSNARQPAYRLLEGMGIEVFTPMVWKLSVRQGRRMRERVPFMRDLLSCTTPARPSTPSWSAPAPCNTVTCEAATRRP